MRVAACSAECHQIQTDDEGGSISVSELSMQPQPTSQLIWAITLATEGNAVGSTDDESDVLELGAPESMANQGPRTTIA